MKKRARNLIILCAVLVLCVGAYTGVRLYNGAQERKAAEEAEAATVYIGSIGTASSLTYSSEAAGTVDMVLDGETWRWAQDGDLPVTQSLVTRVATALTGLTAVRQLEITDDLSAYGLAQPAATLTAEDTDGNTLSLLIGSQNGDNYYAMESGGSVIYTIAATLPGYLDTGLYDMVTKETMAGVDEEAARSITLTGGDGKTFTFRKSVKANGSSTWYAEVNGVEGDQLVNHTPAADQSLTAKERLDKVIGALKSQLFTRCVGFKPTDAELEKFGLAQPALTVSVDYVLTDEDDNKTSGSYTLLVGSKAEDMSDGETTYYYTALEGSDLVYVMDSSDLDPLLAAQAALGE